MFKAIPKCVVSLLLILFLTFQAFAQRKINFSNVTAPLSSLQVSCIFQDSRGFLWVGTEDGLNRFDGYEFKIYRHDPDDSASLLKNRIRAIFEDSRGVLWVSTNSGGLHTYNRIHDNFKRVPKYSFDCEIAEFHEDDTAVWFGGIRHGEAFVNEVNKKTGRERSHTLFKSRTPVHALIPASDHAFWVGVRGTGLFLWDVKKNDIQRKGSPSELHRAVADTRQNLWIATRAGLQKYNANTNTTILYDTHSSPALPVDNVLCLCMDGDYLWIGTENGGLCRLNTVTDELVTFQTNIHDSESLPDNSIWALYRDHQGRIWVGTYSNGMTFIDPLRQKFQETDLPVRNDMVNAIFLDSKKRLWLGTEEGLIVTSSHGIKRYKHSTDKRSLQTNPVLSIYEDVKQRIWVGTWQGGLNRYDEAHDNFVHYVPDEKRMDALSSANVFAIKESHKTQQLLVATHDGLNVMDEQTGTFQHIREGQFEFNNYIGTLFEDNTGTIWVGTLEELLRYDPLSKKLSRFEAATHRDSIHVRGVCNSILEDKHGRLWIATQEGLHLLVDGRFLKRYTIRDGLPSNNIQAMLEDDSGNLWMSTAVGISKFNPAIAVFRNYDKEDGIRTTNFKPKACLRNPQGQFLFAGKGICLFNPDSVRENPHMPNVFITELGILNTPTRATEPGGMRQRQISEIREISIPPAYNYFSLKYVAINFTATSKNQYAYKLEGFQDDWNYVGDQRSAMFTNLDPGTYTFKVKACNNDGVWNEKGAELVIHILPPWWKTWWAKTAAVLFMLGSALLVYKIRVRSIEQQNRSLELQVQKRTEELAQQNEELTQSQEEIAAQRDVVAAQNLELQKARLIIEKQNHDILMRNESLEAEVEKRTRDLVEYNQQLEQFAFISAHNLRAPVARILGLGHILEIEGDNPSETRTITDKMVFTARELDRVVRDLNTVLDIRRNSNSAIAPINLEEELRLIKINLEKEIQETTTTFVEDFSKGSILWAVKPYLDSILLNLISNAIKYRHPERNPVITIWSEEIDDQFVLTIEDNGLGMDMTICKDKLFTLYSRFHSHVEGKGMGLYLVKTQVIAMGGKIDVQSNLDQGTVFRISFKRPKAT